MTMQKHSLNIVELTPVFNKEFDNLEYIFKKELPSENDCFKIEVHLKYLLASFCKSLGGIVAE